METIWGTTQYEERLAEGVWDVCTAGHGGIVVDKRVAERYISPKAKRFIDKPQLGMYHFEEDCEWAIFAFENKDIVPENWLPYIEPTLMKYYPEFLPEPTLF